MGYMAPTVYFPLVVPECMMFEPTETESRDTLDQFAKDFVKVLQIDAETYYTKHRLQHQLEGLMKCMRQETYVSNTHLMKSSVANGEGGETKLPKYLVGRKLS